MSKKNRKKIFQTFFFTGVLLAQNKKIYIIVLWRFKPLESLAASEQKKIEKKFIKLIFYWRFNCAKKCGVLNPLKALRRLSKKNRKKIFQAFFFTGVLLAQNKKYIL